MTCFHSDSLNVIWDKYGFKEIISCLKDFLVSQFVSAYESPAEVYVPLNQYYTFIDHNADIRRMMFDCLLVLSVRLVTGLHALRTRKRLCFTVSRFFRGRDETNLRLWVWSSLLREGWMSLTHQYRFCSSGPIVIRLRVSSLQFYHRA